MKKILTFLMMLLIVACCSTVVTAQVDGSDAGDIPSLKDVKADDSISDLLDDNMPDKELEKILAEGMKRRLRIERQQVAEEINNGIFYEAEDIDRAKALLAEGDNTQADNIKRIMQAFAIVDPVFAKLCDDLANDKVQDAIAGAKKIVNPNEANYFSAAKHYLYAEALAKGAKDYWHAIDAYGNVVLNMSDKISFAAAASIKTGELFEAHGRLYYATDQYIYTLKNYALTLTPTEFKALITKVDKYQEMFNDPMTTISAGMGEAGERLGKIDSGEFTQEKEQMVVAVLRDMIMVMEEKNKKDPKEEEKQGNKEEKPSAGKPGDGEGEKKPGKGKGEGEGKGKGKNPKKPSKPAEQSYLPSGLAGRIDLKAIQLNEDNAESGDWAQLPPRKKQEITELLKSQLSERDREAIRLYFIERAKILKERD